MEERRGYPRAEISFPLECRILPDSAYFYTVSKNLSLAGVGIISNQFIPKTSIVKLRANFIDAIVELKASVAWCNKQRACERYEAGLEFIEKSAIHQRCLLHFLHNIGLA